VLAIACVTLVITFGSSSALASAYGIAVTLTMLTTTALFFLGRETLVPSKSKGLSPLRRALFVLMSRNAQNAADYFQLPSDRTVEIGFPVEL
jgi:K+ transporter